MARSKTGEAVPVERRTDVALAELVAFQHEARESGALDQWLRASVVLQYVDGRRAVEIADILDVGESTVHDWLGWYRREGVAGLRSRFYASTMERDAALTAVFSRFQTDPSRIAGHVQRYRPGVVAD